MKRIDVQVCLRTSSDKCVDPTCTVKQCGICGEDVWLPVECTTISGSRYCVECVADLINAGAQFDITHINDILPAIGSS